MPGTLSYTFPDSYMLKEIEQTMIADLSEDDEIFNEFPMVEEDNDRLIWEQMDNYTGLQQVRGYEGAPRSVNRVGAKSWDMEPGVYGEFIEIGEKELTQRRRLGTVNDLVNIDDLVGTGATHLFKRRLDRIRFILFTLLCTGTFSIPTASGEILHTDSFPLFTATANVAWATSATATPTLDLRNAQLLALGQSVDFGAAAKLWVNRVTWNSILQNANPSDFFGRRAANGATFNGMDEYNSFLASNDLPQFFLYDKAYIDSTNTPQRFIPNNKAVLIGKRTNGAKLGQYRMTRNANNPNLEAGAYTRVVDMGELSIPRRIHVHDGHNGGPVIFFPGAIVVLTV